MFRRKKELPAETPETAPAQINKTGETESAPKAPKMAVASVTLGIIAMVVGFSVWGSVFGIICGAIGMILGLRCRHESEAGQAGFVASLIGFGISICIAGLFIPSFIQALQQGRL